MNEGILIVIFNKFKYSRVMNVNITKNVRFDFYSLDILIHVAHVQSCSRECNIHDDNVRGLYH